MKLNKLSDDKISELRSKYGTPLYVYDKSLIVENINVLKGLCDIPNVKFNYATKANNNKSVLGIIKDSGMKVDSTGYGEVFVNQQVGFTNDQIYVVGNNFSVHELELLVNENINISVDGLDQLKTLGKLAPGYKKVMLRMNPSFGAGANESVVTGGKKTKFGIDYYKIDEAIEIMNKYNLKLIGINQHIGSAYLEHESLIAGVESLLSFVVDNNLNDLQIINFGGGFGVNYERNHNDFGMNFEVLSKHLTNTFETFLKKYPNKEVNLEFEPGRFIVANSGVLIGEVTSIKYRDEVFIGTDIGFPTMPRPVLYNSYHEVEIISANTKLINANIVGNICESGDFMCKNREVTIPEIGDTCVVYDVGAYGFSMASNYNSRPLPAEVLIDENGNDILIRKRQSYNDLVNY